MRPEQIIRSAMQKKNVSLEALAVGIGSSYSTVRNMLAGRRVRFEYLYRTAQLLGLSFDALAPDAGRQQARTA